MQAILNATTTAAAVTTSKRSYFIDDNDNPAHNAFIKTIFGGLYILSFSCSFFGNAFLLIVLIINRKLHTNKNILLMNLFSAGILVSVVCVLPSMIRMIFYYDWRTENNVCKFLTYFQMVSYTVYVAFLVAYVIGRYVLLLYPTIWREKLSKGAISVIALVVWVMAFLFNIPYLLINRYAYITPKITNFCYLTTWRLIIIDDIYYHVFQLVILFVIPEMIMIYVCATVNNVRSHGEKEILLHQRSIVHDVSFDLDSEASLTENISPITLSERIEIIQMRSVNPAKARELQKKSENELFLHNLLRSKLYFVKLLISIILVFTFTTILTQIQIVAQKFSLFVDYQNSYEFKLFVLLNVFLIYSICAVNVILLLFYSKTLRENSLKLLPKSIRKRFEEQEDGE